MFVIKSLKLNKFAPATIPEPVDWFRTKAKQPVYTSKQSIDDNVLPVNAVGTKLQSLELGELSARRAMEHQSGDYSHDKLDVEPRNL